MCGCSGRPRVLTFHLTGATAGGSSTSEVRTGPRMERPFRIKSLSWVPQSATAPGQFVDVLVSSDDDVSDTSAPTGSSIFQGAQGLADLPDGDGDAGLPVADQPFEIPVPFQVDTTGRTLKVVLRYRAPAAGLPAGHVVLVVEEFEAAVPPIVPRPPVVPPVAVPPVESAPPEASPPSTVPPTLPPSFPLPVPRVPASYPNLVAMSLSNCIPRNVLQPARTGAGPVGAVCPDPAVYAARGVVVSSLPATFNGQAQALAQRFTARVLS